LRTKPSSLLHKQQQQESPQLVKSTDMQPASASRHTPLLVVHKVEPHFDQQPHRDHASVISKSSSSTLPSHWDDYLLLEDQNNVVGDNTAVNVNAAADNNAVQSIHRPIAPAPWSAMDGFVVRSADGFLEGPVVVEDEHHQDDEHYHSLPEPTNLEGQRLSVAAEGASGRLAQTCDLVPGWPTSWSDADSWIIAREIHQDIKDGASRRRGPKCNDARWR
jgi:hypothetical protein